jgi:hypothetical protein
MRDLRNPEEVGMKNWHWFDTAYATLLVIAGVAIIGFIVYGIRDCSAQQRCEDLGGHVEKYGCHTVWVTTSCGSNCTITMPTESCDWRCVGAPAERR